MLSYINKNRLKVSRLKGKEFCPCFNTSVTIAGIMPQDLGFMTGKMSFTTEGSSVEGHQDGWGLEHLPCEGRLSNLSFFNLEKRGQLTEKLSKVKI